MTIAAKARRAADIYRAGGAQALSDAVRAKGRKEIRALTGRPVTVPETHPYVADGWIDERRMQDRARRTESVVGDKISVVIPSYNHAVFVRDAIISVACQTYPNIQLVVIDDGSTDESVRIITDTLAGIPLTDVLFVRQSNAGAHAAINRGIELADGQYIAILNSDDVYHPERLATLYEHAVAGDFGLVFSEVFLGGHQSEHLRATKTRYASWLDSLHRYPSLGFALLRWNGTLSTSNFLMSRQLLDRIGDFADCELVHDWEFVLRALREEELGFVREQLVFYRHHTANTIDNRNTVQRTLGEYRDVILGYFAAVRDNAVSNDRAPSPKNYPVYFQQFLDEVDEDTVRHLEFTPLDRLWVTSGLDPVPEVRELVPPSELMELVGSVDADNFAAVGEEFFRYLVEFAGLTPDSAILDIGCGSGRIAIPLTRFLSDNGSYRGFDIVPDAIEWCSTAIAAAYPNFEFAVAAVRNSFYNPDGAVGADEYVFPYPDDSFDVVVLASVFTHMLPAEVDRYLAEIARVLRPGGRVLATAFLENADSATLMASGKSTLTFPVRIPQCSLFDEERPEFAVSYGESYLRQRFVRWGLPVTHVGFGNWCGREQFISYQDLVLAEQSRTLPIADMSRPAVHLESDSAVQLVCVSHRLDIYDRYVGYNGNLDLRQMTKYDNSAENIGIADRYNQFIETAMGSGWVVFMHHDMEFDEPLEPIVSALAKDSIYGVIGARVERGSRYLTWRRVGLLPRFERGRMLRTALWGQVKCLDSLSAPGLVGVPCEGNPVVDTVDCCCVIVHSSLIRQYHLRFNPKFSWHFYSEEFSLRARQDHGIVTRAVQIDCGHYGNGVMNADFMRKRREIVEEFPSPEWASTCLTPPNYVMADKLADRSAILIRWGR